MTSENAPGYSKAVGGPWRPLREFPCWGWLIAVLTVTVLLLPAAAHAGCEQVTTTLAAIVQPQVGPSYVENGHLAIPITPAMAFRGDATISAHPLPVNDIHLQFVQNVTAWSGKAKYAEGATLSGRLGAGAAFPLLDRCSPSNPGCDESTFPFVDNTFKERGQGAIRLLKESDQPTLKVPLGLCQPQRKLKKIDFTTEFVMYLGCYVPPGQLTFAPVKQLRWTARVQGLVTYDLSGRPTFVPGPLSGVHADLATDPTDTPTMSEPLADDALEFVETCTSSPPPPPPPGDPNYDPQPGEDLSPFVFPAGGPRYPARDFDRYYPVEEKLPGMDYYASELDAGNPSIFSHADAGVIAAGAKTAYGRPVGGLRLWVRVTPGESMTGAVIPPAPAYLIRRALKMGHF